MEKLPHLLAFPEVKEYTSKLNTIEKNPSYITDMLLEGEKYQHMINTLADSGFESVARAVVDQYKELTIVQMSSVLRDIDNLKLKGEHPSFHYLSNLPDPVQREEQIRLRAITFAGAAARILKAGGPRELDVTASISLESFATLQSRLSQARPSQTGSV